MAEMLRYSNGKETQGALILGSNWSIFTKIFKYPFTLIHFKEFILTETLVFTHRAVSVKMLNATSLVITKST